MQDTHYDSSPALHESEKFPALNTPSGAASIFYWIMLAASVSVWFIAIRAPLWLDETSSYWEMSKGFWQISSRQGVLFAAQAYILLAFSKVLGTSELALRVPEILAMAGAVYLLYLIAREMFDRDVAWITIVIFCLYPTVMFAAIDVRPYASAALAINGAILCLVRLRNSSSLALAALFGICAAVITYFQLLFAVILFPLLWCFVAFKVRERKVFWQQLGIALVAFAVALIPVLSHFDLMFRTGRTLAFEPKPSFGTLVLTIAPLWLLLPYAAFLVIFAALEKKRETAEAMRWRILLAASIGLFPIVVLYVLSLKTSMAVFVDRYHLVAIPGLALGWGILISALRSRKLRLAFCGVLVAITLCLYYTSPYRKHHGYTWKYALEFAENNASVDGATVVMCSDFPQSYYLPIPQGDAVKDSAMFTPLSYYQLSVPVVGMPRGLNDEAQEDGRRFLASASHRRFLMLAYWPSQPVLDWMQANAASTHQVRQLAEFDRIKILEFSPRN